MALTLGWLVDVLDDEDVKTLHVLDDSRKLTHQRALADSREGVTHPHASVVGQFQQSQR
jgi:hypothetical protein